MAAKEKITLYFPQHVLDEIKAESERQDRSPSWIMERAWRIARHGLVQIPGADELITEATSGVLDEIAAAE